MKLALTLAIFVTVCLESDAAVSTASNSDLWNEHGGSLVDAGTGYTESSQGYSESDGAGYSPPRAYGYSDDSDSTTSLAAKNDQWQEVAGTDDSCVDDVPPTKWAKNTCDECKDAGYCDKSWFQQMGLCAATCGQCAKTLPRLHVNGTKIYDHLGNEFVGKGMNWGRHSVLTLYDSDDTTRMQENLVSSDGTPWINHIRVVFKMIRHTKLDKKGNTLTYDAYDPDEPDKGYMTEAVRTYIDDIVQWATAAKIWVTLTMTYNGGEKPPKGTCHYFVSNSTWREQHQVMWQYLATTYQNTSYMAWMEPWSEAKLGDCTEEEATEWQNEIIEKIHEVDNNVPVALGTHYNQCSAPDHWHALESDQVIYPINFWCPGVTNVNTDSTYGTEASCYTQWGGKGSQSRQCIDGCTDDVAGAKGKNANTTPGKSDYESLLNSAIAKGKELNAPIWVDQWGCEDSRTGYMDWIQDVGSMFAANNISTNWWSWKGACDMCVLAPAIDCSEWKSHNYTSFSDCKTNSAKMVPKTDTLVSALNSVLG